MDREEALKLLQGGSAGIEEWNRWRRSSMTIPDLTRAILRGADLYKADLQGAVLRGADLSGADFREAVLRGAVLREANLIDANLGGADLIDADLQGADLSEAHLQGADLVVADLQGAILCGADLKLARLIRCKLDDASFEDADVTFCHVQETFGRPKPPNRLRIADRPPLEGEDARNFFNPPAVVEVYLTEVLTDEELGAFRFHLGDMSRQGVGIGVHLTGEREEGGGTVLRFQAPTYAEIYDVLPVLLKPFRMSRAVDWTKTYAALPEHDRGTVQTTLARIDAADADGRWAFAARMAEVFGSFPGAKIKCLRDGRNLGVRIDVATNQAMYRKLADQPGRSKAVAKQQIIYLPAAGQPRIALEDHSVSNEVNAKGNIVGSAIGTSNTLNARDINAFINSMSQAESLDPELKRVLIEARHALESGPLTGTDKDDAADDLGKLAEEATKPEPQPGRIKRLFESIKQLAPDVASILSSAAKIGELIKG